MRRYKYNRCATKKYNMRIDIDYANFNDEYARQISRLE